MATSGTNKTPHMMNRVVDMVGEPKRKLPPIQGYEIERITTLERAAQPIVPFVPDLLQMVSEVKQKCQQPKNDLTVDESASIMLFTFEGCSPKFSFYSVLNRTLRTEDRQKLKPWFLYLRLFINALAKLPTAKHRIVYRGVKGDIGQDYSKDGTVVWWAFSSCTSSLDVLERFLGPNGTGTIFNIECDSAKDISGHSSFPEEKEILLFPARQFTVVASLQTGSQNRIIQLRENQPRPPLIHIPKVTPTASAAASLQQDEQLLSKLQEFQRRSKIDLSAQNLDDNHMELIVNEVIIDKQCTWLYLEKNKITSFGMGIIAKALRNNTILEWLDVSHNPLGDEGVLRLTEVLALNNCKLRALHLWSIGLTDEGVEYLADMLKMNRRLTHLGLAENRIGEAGVQRLAHVLAYQNITLEELDLSHTKSINDSSVDSLVQLFKDNRSLTELNLEKCGLSAKGKEKLQQAIRSKNNFSLIL